MEPISRKEELTYRFDAGILADEVKTESNRLKRDAKRESLKTLLNEWYQKKYGQPKEL